MISNRSQVAGGLQKGRNSHLVQGQGGLREKRAGAGRPRRAPLPGGGGCRRGGAGQWGSRRAIADKGVREELAQEALCCEPFQCLTFSRAPRPRPSKRHAPKSSGDLIKSAVLDPLLDPRQGDGLPRRPQESPGPDTPSEPGQTRPHVRPRAARGARGGAVVLPPGATRDGLCTRTPGPPHQPPDPDVAPLLLAPSRAVLALFPVLEGQDPCPQGIYVSNPRSSAQVTAIWGKSEEALLGRLLFTRSSAAAGKRECRGEPDGRAGGLRFRGFDVCRGSPTRLIKPEFLLPMNCH